MKLLIVTLALLTATSAFASTDGKEGGGGGGFCSKHGCLTLSQAMTPADFERLKKFNDGSDQTATAPEYSELYWQPTPDVVSKVRAIINAQPLSSFEKRLVIKRALGDNGPFGSVEKADGFGGVEWTSHYKMTFVVPTEIDETQVKLETEHYLNGFAGTRNIRKFKLFAYRKPSSDFYSDFQDGRDRRQTVLLPAFFQLNNKDEEARSETQALMLIHESAQRYNAPTNWPGSLSLQEIAELDGYFLENYRSAQTGKLNEPSERFLSLVSALQGSLDWNGKNVDEIPYRRDSITTEFFLYKWATQRGAVDLSTLLDVISVTGAVGDYELKYRATINPEKVNAFKRIYPEMKNGIPFRALDFVSVLQQPLGTTQPAPNKVFIAKECGNSRGVLVRALAPRSGMISVVDCVNGRYLTLVASISE